ncbi:hypothetical protein D3870_18645 [Noviherbaspirillum cavernae]|uniref:Uncharacterized protein n=1 Tax=Noviherbaspirillum cavernae TaxID=2320862 RepID=A0A418WV04_9BURK|nr:hypothetical protein [Noviherbaspirillum cavernae]RJF96478.1 hypothetical protein D3870_18645 [Noviherbaspirillum cavernae]
MKWFFLALLVLFGAALNLIILGNSPIHIPALIAVDVALVGLALIWHASYFEEMVIDSNGKELGTALLFFSAGVFIAMLGTSAVSSASCDTFLSSRSYRSNHVARFVESLGYCREPGYIVVCIGCGVAFVGTRWVFRITRRQA